MDGADLLAVEASIASLTAIYQSFLSWAAIIVGALTLCVALFVTAGFGYIKWKAESVAEDAAKETAERAANAYLQAELPQIIATYREMMKDEGTAPSYLREDNDDTERL
jgi:hypothetical protein